MNNYIIIICAFYISLPAQGAEFIGKIVTYEAGSGGGMLIVQQENILKRFIFNESTREETLTDNKIWQIGRSLKILYRPENLDPSGDQLIDLLTFISDPPDDITGILKLASYIKLFTCAASKEDLIKSNFLITKYISNILKSERDKGAKRKLSCASSSNASESAVIKYKNSYILYVHLTDGGIHNSKTLRVDIENTSMLRVKTASLIGRRFVDYLFITSPLGDISNTETTLSAWEADSEENGFW